MSEEVIPLTHKYFKDMSDREATLFVAVEEGTTRGKVYEVIERRPGSIDSYFIGEASEISFRHSGCCGTPDMPVNGTYIMNVWGYGGSYYGVTGMAQNYRLAEDHVYGESHELLVLFDEMPREKVRKVITNSL